MNLNDTIKLMQSDDYKDRFKAEYYQLKIRYDKLTEMLEKWEKGELNFIPSANQSLFVSQLNAMQRYKLTLEERASIEHIIL